MSYQINEDDMNKLVVDGEYVHYSIPVPPIPRACTTYALVRHFWKMCEFAHFVTHALPDHVNRPLDITVIPKKFDPNEIEEGKFFGVISKYRPKNFLTDFEIKSNSIFGMSACHVFYDEFIDDLKKAMEVKGYE